MAASYHPWYEPIKRALLGAAVHLERPVHDGKMLLTAAQIN
jgi:hypothetical protein